MDYLTSRLIDKINLANNGYVPLRYLSADEKRTLDLAVAAGILKVTNGLAHLPATEPEFYPSPTNVWNGDDTDWEAAILASQPMYG